ncbi:MAG: hypothetical protein P1S60_19180, partial [Anaerolineae bacterium]|nr:hypothetical protein [Anaerolineae bacterium]
HIVMFPNLQSETVIPLTVDDTEPACDAIPGYLAADAVTIATRDDSFAWSPDGRRLAFVAMREGPTADLYLYDTITSSIARITQQGAHASRPLWSLDGAFILHTALIGANIDTGMHVQGFWQSTVDGSEASRVHEGEDQLVGWTSGNNFLYYQVDTLCGKHDVHSVDQSSAEIQVWAGSFDRVAADPVSGAVVVAVWEQTAASGHCAGLQ